MNEINRSPDLEMVVLKEISSAIVNERNGTALLRHILDVLYRRMKMLRGTFTIRRGNDLMIEASHGLDEQEMKRGHYHVGEGITGHVAETGRPHVIEDISRDSRFLNRTRTRKSGEKVAFICVPIIHLQQVIGTLSIDRAVDRDTDLERDQKLLEIVGNIVGDALAASLQAHEERAALVAENEKLRELLTTNPGELIGNCSTMLQVYEQIRQVAPSDATVLIRGSSGTGKELVARAVVNLSGRKDKPLVTLNCAAMPENLLESELFGHEKGSFTGATSRRIGRAEAADGGTLFLDEIGDLSLQMQVKLLRFLQEKTFSRVGSNRELHADVRFIAATSRNLEKLMEQGLTIDQAAPSIRFTMSVSSNYFMEIAKFRAARMLWANIIAQYKPTRGCASKMKIHAVTSKWNMTVYDPYVNMLRGTTEAMSAAIAGVHSIEVRPFDEAYEKLDFKLSQAYQALCAYNTVKYMRYLGADGLMWCSLSGGANDGSYIKPPIDFYGYKKQAFYALKEGFAETICFDKKAEVAYNGKYVCEPVLTGAEKGKTYNVKIEIKNQSGKVVCEKTMTVKATGFTFDLESFAVDLKNGYYSVGYLVQA